MRSIALLPHAEPITDDSNAERECTIPTFGPMVYRTAFDRFRIDDATRSSLIRRQA